MLTIGAIALGAAVIALAHLGLAIMLGAAGGGCVAAGRDQAAARRGAYIIAALISVHVVSIAGFDRTPPIWVIGETLTVLAVLRTIRLSDTPVSPDARAAADH
jgi:hypothetical protein